MRGMRRIMRQGNGDMWKNIYGGGLFAMSKTAAICMLITGCFVLFLLLIASVAVWPTLIGAMNNGSELAKGIFWPAVIGAGICLLLSLLLALLMKNGSYQLLSRFVPCFVIELLAIYIGMIVNKVNLAGMISNEQLGGTFMLLTINGVCGVVLAFLPAFLSSLIGWVLHTTLHFIMDLLTD